MDPAVIETVSRSYGRCLRNETFFDAFYERFLASSRRIPPMFASTDFAKQKQLIRSGINFAIMYAKDPTAAFVRSKMEAIGASHSRTRLNVAPELYTLWVNSLVATVRGCDPEFSTEIEAAWREVITPAVQLLIGKY